MKQYCDKFRITISTLFIMFTFVFLSTSAFALEAPEVQWSKVLSGSITDRYYPDRNLIETSDGGYVVLGNLNSDIYVAKLFSDGSINWEQTYGDAVEAESARSIQETTDGGFIILGASNSDFYLTKLDSSGNVVTSFGNQVPADGTSIFGGASYDNGFSVLQTADGGYIMAGETTSFGVVSRSALAAKADANGILDTTWGNQIPANGYAISEEIRNFCEVQATADGGCVLYGDNRGTGSREAVLVKLNTNGTVATSFGNQVPANGISLFGTVGNVSDAYSIDVTSDNGFIMSAERDPYLFKADSNGILEWRFDELPGETTLSVRAMADGGYLIAGRFNNQPNLPFIAKTDSNGIREWKRTVETGTNRMNVAIQTSDTGFLALSSTYPMTVVKFGPELGKSFETAYGTGNDEEATSVQPTADGGYIAAGLVDNGNDTDVSLVKIDSEGAQSWSVAIGGSGDDEANSVQQAADGGYIVLGTTDSSGAGGSDMYLIKTDASGTVAWSNTYGGADDEKGSSVALTADGGYILTGETRANGKQVYLVKTDASGVKTWDVAIGSGNEKGLDVAQTTDGGYIVTGETKSFGNGKQIYLVKTDASGVITWEVAIGGAGDEKAYAVAQTTDGGYIIAGETDSVGAGGVDVYLVKTDSAGTIVWDTTFGGAGDDVGYAVELTADGGYIVTGETDSIGAGGLDAYLIKTDALGNETWSGTFGGAGDDAPVAGHQTADGGYVLAGTTDSIGAGGTDMYVVKLNTYHQDADADDFGNVDVIDIALTQPAGYVFDKTDCNDTDPLTNPGAIEICADGIDQNCNGVADDGCNTYYIDADSDNYGGVDTISALNLPAGYAVASGDCNDLDPAIHPGAYDVADDGIDQNCDGVDDTLYYRDYDSDTYGSTYYTTQAPLPTPPTGYVIDNTDCNDYDASRYPGAPEVPDDGIDQDCDGFDLKTWYADTDSDNYGDPGNTVTANTQPPTGYVSNSLDCDDTDAAINPAAADIPDDGIDQNCDGYDLITLYRDNDQDGYGNPAQTYQYNFPTGYWILDNNDCNDNDAAVNPAATEIVDDGIDNNCDGLFLDTYYLDADADGYGDSAISQVATSAPAGYVLANADCNDADPLVNPGVMDICEDGIDNDCDGSDRACVVNFERIFGTDGTDYAIDAMQTSDGGYIVAGNITTYDGVTLTHSVVIKTDGYQQWKTVFGSGSETLTALDLTSDGGCIVAGGDYSTGLNDYYLAKLDALGNVEWTSTYGGAGTDYVNAVKQMAGGGYAVFGRSNSFSTDSDYDFYLVVVDQNGSQLWSKNYDDPGYEFGADMDLTTDGGFVMIGSKDYFQRIIKADSAGTEEWRTTVTFMGYGSSGAIQQTTDGGYITVGSVWSGGGIYDTTMVRKYSAAGGLDWTEEYTGPNDDDGHDIKQTADGGYIIAGNYSALGWGGSLIKIDALGVEEWSRLYPSNSMGSVEQTSDGGFIVSSRTPGSSNMYLAKTDELGYLLDIEYFKDADADGYGDAADVLFEETTGYVRSINTDCNDADDTIYPGAYEACGAGIDNDCSGALIVCTYYEDADNDAFGNLAVFVDAIFPPLGYILDNTDCDDTDLNIYPGAPDYIGDGIDQDCDGVDGVMFEMSKSREDGVYASFQANDGEQTADGGYILIADYTMYVEKTDIHGNPEWSGTYGGSAGYSIQQTTDGGYIALGWNGDIHLVKIDADGAQEWASDFGIPGNSSDTGYSVQQTADGGYIVSGSSDNYSAGGDYDLWLVKTDALGVEEWSSFYGGTSHESGASEVKQTTDGGYIVTSNTHDGASWEMYVVKTDALGVEEWSRSLGGTSSEAGYSVVEVSDGGFVILGSTSSFGAGQNDMYLVKLDSLGNDVWANTYGGINTDMGTSVIETADGGFALLGYTYGNATPATDKDLYVVKTDASGNQQAGWGNNGDGTSTYAGRAGTGHQEGRSISQTSDGGYIIVGLDQLEVYYSLKQMYMIKTDTNGVVY